MATITVCGLGPGGAHFLTQGALAALKSGAPVYLRTERHPTVAFLRQMGVPIAGTFDGLYEQAGTFAQVYAGIARTLLDQAGAGDVVLAVPGHPLVGEEAVRLLLEQAPARGIQVELAGGPSFLDALLIALRLDPVRGLELLDGLDLERRLPAGDLPLVVMQVHSPAVASDVKLALMQIYPDEHQVTVVRAAGVPDMMQVAVVPLYEIDRLPWVDYLTSLYVPPLPPPGRRRFPLDRLVEVMARLRGPDGCPWDREQTHLTLRPYMLEEAYEAVEAMGGSDMAQLKEELGDVLLQVVFHAQMAAERGDFDANDVVLAITDKLLRRHPHVFGDVTVRGAADVVRNWEAIKAAEKGTPDRPPGLLEGVGKGLPALGRAFKVQKKAAEVGFDWPDIQGPLDKLAEELAELQEAHRSGDPVRTEDELGDLLYAVVNISRFIQVDPEIALSRTVAKFTRRFAYMEAEIRLRGQKLGDLDLAALDALWNEAKGAEK